jgi:hypothetical protein
LRSGRIRHDLIHPQPKHSHHTNHGARRSCRLSDLSETG